MPISHICFSCPKSNCIQDPSPKLDHFVEVLLSTKFSTGLTKELPSDVMSLGGIFSKGQGEGEQAWSDY